MLGAQQWYASETHGKAGHSQGSPDMHSFKAAMVALLGIIGAEHPKHGELHAFIQTLTDLKAFRPLANCNCAKCPHKQSKCTIELSVKSAWEPIVGIFLSVMDTVEGCECKFGRGPRTGLERIVQKRLEKVAKKCHIKLKGGPHVDSGDLDDTDML